VHRRLKNKLAQNHFSILAQNPILGFWDFGILAKPAGGPVGLAHQNAKTPQLRKLNYRNKPY
jgi:hypothetical protein